VQASTGGPVCAQVDIAALIFTALGMGESLGESLGRVFRKRLG